MKYTEKISKNNDAVSPVIGVILMVAITVILAAVIAAYVFGVGSGVPKQYVVGATVTQVTDSQIDITYFGGPDTDSVDYLEINIKPADGAPLIAEIFNGTSTPDNGGSIEPDGKADIFPGSTSIFENNQFTYRDHVIVTAIFLDGSKQVIMDVYV